MLVLHKFHVVSIAVYKALQYFLIPLSFLVYAACKYLKKKFIVAFCSCHLLSSPLLNTMTDQNQDVTVLQYNMLSCSFLYVVFRYFFLM